MIRIYRLCPKWLKAMDIRPIFYTLALIGSCLLPLSPTQAQVEISGSADMEFTYAGEDSKFILNQVDNVYRKPHFGLNQLNLFVFAPLSESMFFQTRLLWHTWGSGTLNSIAVTLAAVTWEPDHGRFNLTLGRHISPFGLFPHRGLSDENAFANFPLIYGYFTNITKDHGFFPIAGDNGDLGSSKDVGSVNLYYCGYNTGIVFNWFIVQNILNWEISFSNAAPTFPSSFTNEANYAVVSRIGIQPVIFWRQGLSVAYGGFMQSGAVNAALEDVTEYKQLVLGTDFILAYGIAELAGEVIYTNWHVPAFIDGGFLTDDNGDTQVFDLANLGGYGELKIEPPFLPGIYLAGRVGFLSFDPFIHNSYVNSGDNWDADLVRYAAAVGYKLNPNTLLKLTYTNQSYSDAPIPAPELFSYRAILTLTY